MAQDFIELRRANESDRRQCERCDGVIKLGSWIATRDRQALKNSRTGPLTGFIEFHCECALDVDLIGFARAVNKCPEFAKERRDLTGLLLQRTYAIAKRSHSRHQHVLLKPDPDGPREEARESVAPTAPFDDDPEVVAPAMDPSGRPRVRVLCCGSASSLETRAGVDFWSSLRAGAWASSKREYEFVRSEDFYQLPREDPARPIIATLYCAVATQSARTTGYRTLSLWASVAMPAPVLWLLGLSAEKPRDSHTLRFREILAACGLSADESPVVCAPKATTHALNALVAVLDEYATGKELRQTEDASLGAARVLQRQWEQDDIANWTNEIGDPLFDLATYAHSSATEATLLSLFDQVMAEEQYELLAGLVRRNGVRDPDRLSAWLLGVLRSDLILPFGIERVVWWVVKHNGKLPMNALLQRCKREAAKNDSGADLETLAALIVQYGTADQVGALRATVLPGGYAAGRIRSFSESAAARAKTPAGPDSQPWYRPMQGD